MNVKFQPIGPAYRTPAASQKRHAPQTGKAKGNYDTVTLSGTQANQEESFARILSRRAASQIPAGAAPERVQELNRQVSDGTYRPDADRIAGRLLGLH